MEFKDRLLKFIGSKWFVFCLGIVMIFLLPFTWHNFQVIIKAGQASQFKFLVAVFPINLICVGLCVYKFMGMISNKKPIVQEEW